MSPESETQRRPTLGRGRMIAFSLVAAGISFAVTLLFVEFFLRLVLPQPASWMPIYRSHPSTAATFLSQIVSWKSLPRKVAT